MAPTERLMAHRDRLLLCKSFRELQAAQVQWVNYLIAEAIAREVEEKIESMVRGKWRAQK